MFLFALLLSFASVSVAAPVYPETCSYAPVGNGEFHAVQGCTRLKNGKPQLSARVLADLFYDAQGLAQVWVNGAWHWVRRDGGAAAVVTMDNGADPFQEGFSRGLTASGMVYYNPGLVPVLSTPYDWAWPFEQGLAVVCSACVRQRSPDGEHNDVVGGQWGVIDRSGKLLEPLTGDRAAVWARWAAMQRH